MGGILTRTLEVRDVEPGEVHRAGCGTVEPGEDPQGGRFAAPRRPHE